MRSKRSKTNPDPELLALQRGIQEEAASLLADAYLRFLLDQRKKIEESRDKRQRPLDFSGTKSVHGLDSLFPEESV